MKIPLITNGNEILESYIGSSKTFNALVFRGLWLYLSVTRISFSVEIDGKSVSLESHGPFHLFYYHTVTY